MGNVTTIGIDLAKNSFSVRGVDAAGAVVLRRTVSRGRVLELLMQQPPCLIGLEACSGAHEWARRLQQFGHRVKLMAPRFVAPYRKNGKNDGNDAEAICEAVSRPSMRFVPIKTAEQQAVLCLHRVRQGFIEERTATINRLRGLLAEFGFVLSRSTATVRRGLVPRQHSTGGKQRLGHITGRGDPYLRTLLVMGARSVLQRAVGKNDPLSRWALAVRARRGYHRACVAVAAKNARVLWAMLSHGA